MEPYANTKTFNGPTVIQLPPGLYYIGNVSYYISDNPFYSPIFTNKNNLSAHYYRGLEHVFVANMKDKTTTYEGTDDNLYTAHGGVLGICSATLINKANKNGSNDGKIYDYPQGITVRFDGRVLAFEIADKFYMELKPHYIHTTKLNSEKLRYSDDEA